MNINYSFRISLPGSYAGKSKWSRMVGRTMKERDKDNQKLDHQILCCSSCTQRQTTLPHQMMGKTQVGTKNFKGSIWSQTLGNHHYIHIAQTSIILGKLQWVGKIMRVLE